MNKKQSAALRSFRRVREFVAAHTPADAPPSFARKVGEYAGLQERSPTGDASMITSGNS